MGIVLGASGLQVGDPAPDFTLPDQDGKQHTLSETAGIRVVYFFPKAGTPG
jgi:peroxiredoxin Q/BCP